MESDERPEWAAPIVTSQVETEQPTTARFAEEDIAAMAAALGISHEDAVLRMQVEEATIGITAQLYDRYPDSFAGVWIAQGAVPNLVVAFAESNLDVEQRRQEIAEGFAFPNLVVVREVAHSQELLDDLFWRLHDIRSSIRSGQSTAIEGLAATGGMFDITVDILTNTVVVGIDDTFDAAFRQKLEESLRSAFDSDAVKVSKGLISSAACTRANCQWDMMGGLRLEHGSSVCSSAFTAGAIISGSIENGVISADHCVHPGDVGTWRKNGPGGHYGRVYRTNYFGDSDVEFIRHEDPDWDTDPIFYVGPSEPIRAVSGVVAYWGYTIGHWVGKSGAAPGHDQGTDRGPIIALNVAPSLVPSSYNFVKADVCVAESGDGAGTIPGDSGGTVFRNYLAYGVVYGGAGPNSSGCNQVIFSRARAAEIDLNVFILP